MTERAPLTRRPLPPDPYKYRSGQYVLVTTALGEQRKGVIHIRWPENGDDTNYDVALNVTDKHGRHGYTLPRTYKQTDIQPLNQE